MVLRTVPILGVIKKLQIAWLEKNQDKFNNLKHIFVLILKQKPKHQLREKRKLLTGNNRSAEMRGRFSQRAFQHLESIYGQPIQC